MGKERARHRAVVLFCPGLLMDVTKRFLALGNGVKLVNFPDWQNTSSLWHLKHCEGSHLMIKPTSGKAVQLYENPKHSYPQQSGSPARFQGRCGRSLSGCRCPALRPCQASALCGPRPQAGGAGRRGQEPGRGRSGLGEETPPERALRPGERARQQLWRKGKRRRRAAGELWGCGRPPSRSPPSPPRRGRGERGRNAPPASALSPRPAALGACAESRWEPAGSPSQTPPVLGSSGSPERKGPVKTRARHKTRAVPSLEPGGRSSLNDSFNMR